MLNSRDYLTFKLFATIANLPTLASIIITNVNLKKRKFEKSDFLTTRYMHFGVYKASN